jgi:hypothetical protein
MDVASTRALNERHLSSSIIEVSYLLYLLISMME